MNVKNFLFYVHSLTQYTVDLRKPGIKKEKKLLKALIESKNFSLFKPTKQATLTKELNQFPNVAMRTNTP